MTERPTLASLMQTLTPSEIEAAHNRRLQGALRLKERLSQIPSYAEKIARECKTPEDEINYWLALYASRAAT